MSSDSESSTEPVEVTGANGEGRHRLADFIATSVTRIVAKHMWGAIRVEISDLLASIPRDHYTATPSRRRGDVMPPDEIANTLVLLFVEDAKEQRSYVYDSVLDHLATCTCGH